jgi:hypothetical protein
MKRIIAFLLLSLFINSSILLPQVNELCGHHSCGKQSNHVNSILEWVNEVLLEHTDNTPEDEDDELIFVNSILDEGFCHRTLHKNEITPHHIILADRFRFAEYDEGNIPCLIFDITAPPPEANGTPLV